MKRTPLLLFVSALALTASACQNGDAGNAATEAAAGTAIGIDMAAMDKAVKPGDDFYRLRQWQLGEDDRNPGRPLVDRRLLHRRPEAREAQVKRTDRRHAQGQSGGGQQRSADRQLLQAPISTPPRSTRRDRARQGRPRRDRRDRRQARAGAGDRRARSAPTSIRSTRPISRPKICSACSSRRGSTTPGETLPYLMQGGLGMPEREYYLSADADMAEHARPAIAPIIEAVMRAAGNPDRGGARRRASSTSRPRSRAPMRPATRARTSPRARQVWTRADLEKARRASTGPRLLDAAQLGGAPKFEAYHAGAIPQPRRAGRLGAARRVEGLARLPHAQPAAPTCCPTPIRDASFAFYGTALGGTPQQRSATSSRSTPPRTRSRTRSARPMSTNISRPRPRPKSRRWSTNIKAAFAKRVEALDWMAPATKAEALKKVETIVVGVGYPDSWRDYSALTISADDAYANAKAAEPRRISPPARQDRQADGPQRMVDAAAARQRGQSAGPERAQLPGRDPRQRPFFDPKRRRRLQLWRDRRVIGHEISHSFDNNGAAFDSTGRAAQLVDPGRPRQVQRRPGNALAAQYDTYEPFPGVTSTAS